MQALIGQKPMFYQSIKHRKACFILFHCLQQVEFVMIIIIIMTTLFRYQVYLAGQRPTKGLFTWYRNEFYSWTSSFHRHIFHCICLHDPETKMNSFQNDFIPVFNPNEILVLVWDFILVSCKLKRSFVPE